MLTKVKHSIVHFFGRLFIKHYNRKHNLVFAAELTLAERYPLLQSLTLHTRIGLTYNPKSMNRMFNPEYGSSYFHKEYDSKGYKKFMRCYHAANSSLSLLQEHVNAILRGEGFHRNLVLDVEGKEVTLFVDGSTLGLNIIQELGKDDPDVLKVAVEFYEYYIPQIGAVLRKELDL